MFNTLLNSKTKISLLFIILCLPLVAAPRGTHIFSSDHDLTSSLINQVFIDSEGFVWVATESGLNRYDGSKFTKYKNIPTKPGSLAHDYVNGVMEDSKGNLFVCTHKGVQLYNPYKDDFISGTVRDDGSQYSAAVSTILERSDGRLFAIGYQVNEIVVDGDKIIVKRLPISDNVHNANHGIVDRQDNIWVSNGTKGLIKVRKDFTTKEYLNNDGDVEVSTLAMAPDGTLYVGSAQGHMYIYNPNSDTFQMVTDPRIEGKIIAHLYPLTNGQVYVSTDGAGLFSYSPTTATIDRVLLPVWLSNMLKIHSLALDCYNNLWLGIYQRGLLMIPSQESGFNSIDQRSGKNAYIGHSCVSALLRDPDGTLWVGTDNDGIYSVTDNFTNSRHYTDGLPKVIMRIFRDSAGNLWIGSYDGGTGILNPATGAYNRIPLVTSDGQKVYKVFAFAQTPDGCVWIATMGSGLFKYDPATRTAKHMDNLKNSTNYWISDIIYSKSDKHLYLGTFDGLYKVNPVTLESEMLTRGTIVTTIFEDPESHIFWLGTSSGLASSHNGSVVSDILTISDGLPSNSIYAIQKSGNSLWISTNNGISQYNPETNTFVNYDVNEGLQSNEFYKNSSCIDNDGNIFFGGINGLSYFRPENITNAGKKLDLRITDFYIGGESVRDGKLSDGKPVIKEPLHRATTFYLSHLDNSFSIEFAPKQIINSTLTDFYYSFDGSEWQKMPPQNNNLTISDGNLLTFNKVKSGRHTLRIKAVDNGVESDTISVDIVVDYPWWASWWAYIIYTLIAAAMVYVLIRHLRNRAKRHKRELDRQHEEDIKEAKLQFFTNISHEIRTPLTLVMSPIQKLLKEDGSSERQRVYRTILRNSQRIHKLVNEIMDLRKIDNKQMKLHFREIDVVGFLNDLYETFLPAARTKDIDFTFDHNGLDEYKAWVDPANFDKVVMNLLSNAIKFTPKGGKVLMTLTTGHDDNADGPLSDYFMINVSDTGIGIPDKDKKHIFERFYQSNNNKVGGTGIGLHLTHSLVELHHGTIDIFDNTEGSGSDFAVKFPAGNEHLSPNEIDDTVTENYVNKNVIEMNTLIADQSVTPEAEKASTPASRKLVYIVDDDSEVRNYLVESMSEKYRIEAFENGVAALEAVHRNVPDLIISDVMMPEMDGLTLLAKLRQNVNFNHIPVILLTAKTREEEMLEGIDSGADFYITKPFNIEILMSTARNLIENRQMLRNVYSGNQNQVDKVDDIKVLTSDEKLLDRIMKVVNRNIGNPNITVEMIAQEIGISRVHLHRKLKELTNQSTRDFIRNIRLQQAAKLLREKKLSVAEVSDFVGFKHPNNFSTNFKEMFGMSPSAYAEQYHGEADAEEKAG